MRRIVVSTIAGLAATVAFATVIGSSATAGPAALAVTATISATSAVQPATTVPPAKPVTSVTSATPVTPAKPVTSAAKSVTTAKSVTAAKSVTTAKPVTTATKAPTARVQADRFSAKAVRVSVAQARTNYVTSMYRAVVPARQRAVLAGHYTLGYNLSGLSCGTGCTGSANGVVRSSFNAVFFGQPVAYQRNILAHEAAHAYGFLRIANYATPSWSRAGGWQARFHALDRSFAGHYDAEAWASCVAWKESGLNNRVIQINHPCTAAAARLAMAQIR